ncbi:MAG: hypothetical protein Q8N13_11040 [Acidovorax sp.]|nr:hypothetical protein [Acidovorax sp.]
MAQVHPTIARLYEAANILRDVKGQSAVARLLNVTPQVVKNWETRGLSNEGALLAQNYIGCDANWLLHGAPELVKTTWQPPELLSPPNANQTRGTYSSEPSWPFKTVSRDQFEKLTAQQLKHVEDGIHFMLNVREPPSNQREPDSYPHAA